MFQCFLKTELWAQWILFSAFPTTAARTYLSFMVQKEAYLHRGTIGQGDAGEMTAYLEDDNAGYDAAQSKEFEDRESMSIRFLSIRICAEIEEFSCAILENREPLNSPDLGLEEPESSRSML